LAVFRSVGPGSILRAVSPEEWQVWTLTGEAQLRETLHRQLAQYQDAKTDAHMRGAAHRISNLLLRQNGEPGYVPAVANYLRQEMMRTDGPRPKLFVRMVQNTAEAPLPIPLGIAALASSDNSPDSASPAAGVVSAGPRLLGERFDIRMSLEQQYPDRPTGCIQRWVSVVPSEKTNEIDAATRELLGALQKRKYSSQLTSLCETPGNCYREYSDLVHFLSVPQAAAEPSTVLTLLSHHGLGAYSMQAEGPYSPQQHLTEQDLARTFTEPSLAILVACASGAVDAAPFLRGFNRLGFSSIIATHTSISVALAADFMDCFMDAVEHAAPADTLDSVFYRATQECLRSRPNPDDRDSEISPARPYGAQALKFFLAGSRNIRVCPPNTQARSPK